MPLKLGSKPFAVQLLVALALPNTFVLNGAQVPPQGVAARSTAQLIIFDSKSGSSGDCTGIIISKDLLLTACHCLKSDHMRVHVRFGVGGGRKFDLKTDDEGYVSSRRQDPTAKASVPAPEKEQEKEESPWKNGYLTFDEKSQQAFHAMVGARADWHNYAEKSEESDKKSLSTEKLFDLALVKISGIPRGYKPVKIAERMPTFNSSVMVAGWGLGHRKANSVFKALRWSPHQVIGHFTLSGERTAGWQLYSPKGQSACFGDSGGPAFIEEDGELKVLGVLAFVYNDCANDIWLANPRHFHAWLQDAAAKLGTRLPF